MVKITPAAPADIPAAADVLAVSLREDVATVAISGLLRPTAARLSALLRPFVRTGAFRHGRVDLARRASDGVILGVALWEPPGSVARLTHLTHQAVELPAFFRALGWRGMVRAARNQANLASHRPAEPHWYLAMIGVSSEARGAGVGSALLASRLAAIDTARAPAYLESSNERNRTLYLRYGFEVISTITGLSGARPAAMWRAARTSPALP